MNAKPEMLDFVKAMSNPNRLRIIGLLSQTSLSRTEIASRLDLSPKEALNHLAYLEHVGAILQSGESYTLNDDKLATMARDKLAQEVPSFKIPSDFDDKSRKLLKAFLTRDGGIRLIPPQPNLQVVLKYLVQFFEFDANYTEKEVNTIIRRFNEDTASLRRELVEAGMLARKSDGSRYWRVK